MLISIRSQPAAEKAKLTVDHFEKITINQIIQFFSDKPFTRNSSFFQKPLLIYFPTIYFFFLNFTAEPAVWASFLSFFPFFSLFLSFLKPLQDPKGPRVLHERSEVNKQAARTYSLPHGDNRTL